MPDDYGLRRVIANGKAGAELWPHDSRRVPNTGLVQRETDADVTMVETIPNTHQRWDKDYPGPGLFGPAAKGPAVRR